MSFAERTSRMIPDSSLAEAAVWITRLRDDSRNPAIRTAFKQWEQDPTHKRAFKLVTEVWNDAGHLRRIISLVPVVRSRSNGRSRYFGVAAALVVLFAVGIFVYGRGDVFVTGIGEQQQVMLDDGSRIFLNTATRIVVNYASEARRVNVTRGEVLFDVAKRPDWPFIVTAGDRQVTALGTSFVVRRDPQRLVVTLVEGNVSVAEVLQSFRNESPLTNRPPADQALNVSPSHRTYTLVPRQRLTFIEGQDPVLDTASIEESTAWRSGQVVMNEMLLSTAAAEMNRYSTLNAIVVKPEVQHLLVNGLFQAGDSASFANAVARAYGLQLDERGRELILGPAGSRQ